MSDGMTDEARRDRIFQRRTDERKVLMDLDKICKPSIGPVMGGLITDTMPGRLKALEERVAELEKLLKSKTK